MVPSFAYYMTLLKRDFVDFCNDKLQSIGLSKGQVLFLIYIGKHPDCSQKELANDLDIDHGHATRTIYKLVENGFITQRRNVEDKRAHILSLTDKGTSAFQTSYDLFHEWDALILKDLANEQQTQLIQYMKQLVQTTHDKKEELI